MPLYRVAPTRQLPHTIDLIQRSGAPRFLNEVERDQQYPDPEIGALCVVNTTVEVFNGTGWIPVGGGQPTRINNLQDVDARFPPDGALLTWSSAAQAWGWTMPVVPTPECVPWSDNFERANGSLGSDWAAYTFPDDTPTWTYTTLEISSGAAVADMVPQGSGAAGRVISTARRAEAQDPDQAIEVTVENATWNNGYVTLHTHASGANHACRTVEFNFFDDGDGGGEIYVVGYRVAAGGSWTQLADVSVPYPAEPIRLGVEADATGQGRAYVNDSQVLTWTDSSPATGPYVAVGTLVYNNLGSPYTSPRILSATGGCVREP